MGSPVAGLWVAGGERKIVSARMGRWMREESGRRGAQAGRRMTDNGGRRGARMGRWWREDDRESGGAGRWWREDETGCSDGSLDER